MTLVAAAFPALVAELRARLIADGRDDVAEQLAAAEVTRVSFDDKERVGYIHIEARSLNVVERNIIGVRPGDTFPVNTSFKTVLDVDNLGRLAGIELLDPGPLIPELTRLAAG